MIGRALLDGMIMNVVDVIGTIAHVDRYSNEKAALLVMIITILSKIVGFLREIVLSYV